MISECPVSASARRREGDETRRKAGPAGRAVISRLAVVLGVAGLAWVATPATGEQGVRADGGYEANVLPADAGWVEVAQGFLGDFVSVQDGVMTYDGVVRAAPTTCGMRPSAPPRIEEAGTIEYRVRCRAIGGDPSNWYQFFLSFYLYTNRYAVRDSLGHYEFDDSPVIHTGYRLPRKSGAVPPPTSTGRWEADEWVTVRHVVEDAGDGGYTLRSWASGPGGTHQYVDVLAEQAGYAPRFGLEVSAKTAPDARFDLDYIRWSGRAMPFGTPLGPADEAPRILSLEPLGGTGARTAVTIKGGNFNDRTTVLFGDVAASDVACVDAHTITCVVPGRDDAGWVDVRVRNRAGVAARPRAFFFGSLPTIRGVEPARGTNRGGTHVSIRGGGFQSGARVLLGAADAEDVRLEDDGLITCTTPPTRGLWHGPTELSLVNPDGGKATRVGAYTYQRSSDVKPKALGWHLDLVDFNLPLAIQKLEEMPFHGVLLRAYRGLHVGPGTFTDEDLELNRAILRATDFRRFTDNFLQVNFTGPSELPARGFWDDWTPVLASYRRHARLAREAGFKGLWLDVEAYSHGAGPELGSAAYVKKGRDPADIRKQVRLRARQLMTTVLGAFPDITIMLSFGLTHADTPDYDLLPTFCDGLLEAIASDTAFARARVIDGYEPGYYILTPESYRHAYDRIRKPGGNAYQRTERPDLWARFGSAAFGNYPDIHPPEAYAQQFRSAMSQTDAYVWLFTNGTFFFAWAGPSLAPNSPFADRTDQYIDALARINDLPRSTPPGRWTRLIDLGMDEGHGRVAANGATDAFHGRLTHDPAWTTDTPELPKAPQNAAALDLRGVPQAVVLEQIADASRSGPTRHMGSSHLGNLYFTDHTIEFSFWWDGAVSAHDQYLYGAAGGVRRDGEPDAFLYAGRIPAGGRVLEHCQRGNYGGSPGCIAIDLERARQAGLCQFGQWTNVAIAVNTIDTRKWRLHLNGRDVTGTDWAGPVKGRETVEGILRPDKAWRIHEVPIDLVLGACHRAEGGIGDHFDGMLDAFRITAGQVPAGDLLSVP